MLCRCAPARKTGRSRVSKPLRKDWQNARAVITESPRQRRANRAKNCQFVSGAKQDIFRVARDDQQEHHRYSWRLRRSGPRRIPLASYELESLSDCRADQRAVQECIIASQSFSERMQPNASKRLAVIVRGRAREPRSIHAGARCGAGGASGRPIRRRLIAKELKGREVK